MESDVIINLLSHPAVCLVLVATLLAGCRPSAADTEPVVTVRVDDEAQRVDVLVDGEPFTSYVYSDSIAVLKKPVLFPIRAANGTPITRGYPVQPIPGERVDHPHQVGLWLNYGSVNGLDFWNNSSAIPPERAHEMGTIRHVGIEMAEGGEGKGELAVAAEWLNSDNDVIVRETTRFLFHAAPDLRIIDRLTTLTAGGEDVWFEDNKEGLVGMRVTRALEMPTDERLEVVGPDGGLVASAGSDGATGIYVNSEGVRGYPDVWGMRASWTMLSGVVEGDSVAVAIFDHPDNVGYPTYWHARDYGLFAANPLGQAVFSEGAERLDFSLEAGTSTTFRYRVLIYRGSASPAKMEEWYDQFATAEL